MLQEMKKMGDQICEELKGFQRPKWMVFEAFQPWKLAGSPMAGRKCISCL